MSETPSQILWREAGEPTSFVDDVQDVPDGTVCACCGGPIAVGVTLADTFTGNEDGWPHFADASSEWVCRGCDFVSKGRWKDQLRLWSILWRADGGLPDHHPTVYEHIDAASYDVRLAPLIAHAGDRVQITNRGALDGLLDLLFDPPDGRWFAALAESGKKKITRFASVTSGDPWAVQFEYQTVRSSTLDFARTAFDVASMRALGVSAERIRSGRLDPSFDQDHVDRLRWHNEQLKQVREHPRFELALFCATQEYTDDLGRRAGHTIIERGAARPGGPLSAGDAAIRQHRRDRTARLVEARASRPGVGGVDGVDVPRDAGPDGGEPGDPGADEADGAGSQLDLF